MWIFLCGFCNFISSIRCSFRIDCVYVKYQFHNLYISNCFSAQFYYCYNREIKNNNSSRPCQSLLVAYIDLFF